MRSVAKDLLVGAGLGCFATGLYFLFGVAGYLLVAGAMIFAIGLLL